MSSEPRSFTGIELASTALPPTTGGNEASGIVPQSRSDEAWCPTSACGYVRIEQAGENEFFIAGGTVPHEATGVTIFITVYTTFMAACFTITYFFLLYYWSVPYMMPLVIASQLFLQFVLFFYSDYFCRLAYLIYFRYPSGTERHYCFCCICDWILILCYFMSWTAAVIVLAPVFYTYRKIMVFPPLKDTSVSALGFTPLHNVSFVYFQPSVAPDYKIIDAMLIPTTAISHIAVDSLRETFYTSSSLAYLPESRKFSLYNRTLTETRESESHTIMGAFHEESPTTVFRTLCNYMAFPFSKPSLPHVKSSLISTGYPDPSVITSTPTTPTKWHSSNYAHRLWPSLWSGTIPQALVAVVLLKDNHQRNLFRPPFPPAPNVWAVCSDAATIGCDCSGLNASRVTHPFLCSHGGLCGLQMSSSMAYQSSIKTLVARTKTVYNMSQSTPDIFMCLTDPALMEHQIQEDVHWGFVLAVPFFFVFIFVSTRLLVFYVCQAPVVY